MSRAATAHTAAGPGREKLSRRMLVSITAAVVDRAVLFLDRILFRAIDRR